MSPHLLSLQVFVTLAHFIPGSWSVEVVFNRLWSLPATPFPTLLTCEVERRHLEVQL